MEQHTLICGCVIHSAGPKWVMVRECLSHSSWEKRLAMSREQILEHFTDGKRRYLESALLNKIIESIYRGASPYPLLNEVINIVEHQQKALFDCEMRRPIRIEVTNQDLGKFGVGIADSHGDVHPIVDEDFFKKFTSKPEMKDVIRLVHQDRPSHSVAFKVFTENEISRLQTKVHAITGDGDVMKLFNELLGIGAGSG